MHKVRDLTVLIVGPAGLGKSRLARETAALAERMGLGVYVGNCLDRGSRVRLRARIGELELRSWFGRYVESVS